MGTAWPAGRALFSGRGPERPATRPSQVEAASPPSGVVAPIPVTTTVRLVELTGILSPTDPRDSAAPPPGGGATDQLTEACGSVLVVEDVLRGVADGLEVLDFVVRELDVDA